MKETLKEKEKKCVLGEGMICLWKMYHLVWVLKGQCGYIQKTASLVFQEAAVTLNMTLPKWCNIWGPISESQEKRSMFSHQRRVRAWQAVPWVVRCWWAHCGIRKIRQDVGTAAQGRDGDSLRDKMMKEFWAAGESERWEEVKDRTGSWIRYVGKRVNISPGHFPPIKILLPFFFPKVFFVVVVVVAVFIACVSCLWETYSISTKWKVSNLSWPHSWQQD